MRSSDISPTNANKKEINYANGRKKKVFIHKKWNEKS